MPIAAIAATPLPRGAAVGAAKPSELVDVALPSVAVAVEVPVAVMAIELTPVLESPSTAFFGGSCVAQRSRMFVSQAF